MAMPADKLLAQIAFRSFQKMNRPIGSLRIADETFERADFSHKVERENGSWFALADIAQGVIDLIAARPTLKSDMRMGRHRRNAAGRMAGRSRR